MKKDKYETAELEIIEMEPVCIVTTSNDLEIDENTDD